MMKQLSLWWTDLESASSLTCNRGSQSFVFNTFAGVNWTLTDLDGNKLRGSMTMGPETKLNFSECDPGTYIFKLEYAGQSTSFLLTF